MGTTNDDIDEFITDIHCVNSVGALDQSISIPVGIVMHLKSLHFEFYARNKCDTLPDA